MDRTTAWNIVTEFTASDSLCKHMLSVEAAMRAYAPRFNADAERWGVVGLLHDFDYERYPDVAVEGHPVIGRRFCASAAWTTRSSAAFCRTPRKSPALNASPRWRRRCTPSMNSPV